MSSDLDINENLIRRSGPGLIFIEDDGKGPSIQSDVESSADEDERKAWIAYKRSVERSEGFGELIVPKKMGGFGLYIPYGHQFEEDDEEDDVDERNENGHDDVKGVEENDEEKGKSDVEKEDVEGEGNSEDEDDVEYEDDVDDEADDNYLRECTDFAINWFNDRTPEDYGKLEFVKHIRVNCKAPAIWYLMTLEARNTKSGESSVFEVKVYKALNTSGSMYVTIFRPQRQQSLNA